MRCLISEGYIFFTLISCAILYLYIQTVLYPGIPSGSMKATFEIFVIIGSYLQMEDMQCHDHVNLIGAYYALSPISILS